MSLCDQRNANDSNPSGKFEHTPTRGVQQFSPLKHKGYAFSVGRRMVGVTVRRVQYSVSIQEPTGRQVRYLDNFTTMQAAQQAARHWIDTAAYHERLEKVREQARQAREAKLRQALLNRLGA